MSILQFYNYCLGYNLKWKQSRIEAMSDIITLSTYVGHYARERKRYNKPETELRKLIKPYQKVGVTNKKFDKEANKKKVDNILKLNEKIREKFGDKNRIVK